MVVTLYFDSETNLVENMPWGVRLAATRHREVRLIVALERLEREECRRLEGEHALAEDLRAGLDAELGADGWREAEAEPSPAESVLVERPQAADAEQDAQPRVMRVEFWVASTRSEVETWLRPAKAPPCECLVAVLARARKEDEAAAKTRDQILAAAMCEVVIVRPGLAGKELPGNGLTGGTERRGVLLTTAFGHHASAAVQWSVALEEAGFGPVQALVVQADIGRDSREVGSRTLEHRLGKHATGVASGFERLVNVNAHRHVGIREEYVQGSADLILLGATKLGAFGQRWRGTISKKVLRTVPEATVAIVRAAIPLTGRTRRRLANWFQGRVPQLERDNRLALVEKVQSNSQWDFDFVALTSLSTLIAASGLIANSGAVIIGAMLVAPLMTPIMGVGMALVQGNPRLIRLALRSIALGFVTAFVLGVLLGLTQSDLEQPTPEMLGRHWPGLLDLFVAFIAGLAGVYSSSRPNLVAALPGVAIAAALVPPIATAGVALSIGEFDLCLGATLLFLTNFVAIVLASSFGMWAVGMREGQSGSRLTRLSGGLISLAALGLAIGLSLFPNLRGRAPKVPEDLRSQLVERLGAAHRVLELELEPLDDGLLLVMELAGGGPPGATLMEDLARIAERALDTPTRVRVRLAWEFEGEALESPASPASSSSPGNR